MVSSNEPCKRPHREQIDASAHAVTLNRGSLCKRLNRTCKYHGVRSWTVIGLLLVIGCTRAPQSTNTDLGESQTQNQEVRQLNLENLAKGCSVTNVAGIPVKFYPTPLPTSYNLTAEEVCNAAGELVDQMYRESIDANNKLCSITDTIVKDRFNGRYADFLRFLQQHRGEGIGLGDEYVTTVGLAVSCSSESNRHELVSKSADRAGIYSFGSFMLSGKLCRGYLAELSIDSLKAKLYYLYGDGKAGCPSSRDFLDEYAKSKGITLYDLNHQHGVRIGDFILSEFGYEGELPSHMMEDGVTYEFVTPEVKTTKETDIRENRLEDGEHSSATSPAVTNRDSVPSTTTEATATSITPSQDVVQTRYGKLEVKSIGEFEKGIVLGTDVLFKRESGYLNLEQVFQIGSNDVVLVRNSEGGSGTIDSHFFITLTPGVPPKLSEEFMAQGSSIEPVQKGEQILVDLGYNEGLHETLTYQDAQISIQKSAASGFADEDDCNYLYNEIYMDYVQNGHTSKAQCGEPPEEVGGQATARSYFSLSNDPRLNLNQFQNIAKSSCQKGDWIKYSEFKQKVCGVASSTTGSDVVGETPAAAQPFSSGEAKPLATKLTSLRSPPTQSGTANTLINDMIAMSIENNNEKLVELRDRILTQPKPLRGDRKKARKLNDQGLGYFKAEQYAEAARVFQQATQLDPSDVEIVNNLGYALLEEGRLQEASEALTKALLISPDRTPAWTNLGQVYAMMGQKQQAVACFTNAYRFSKNTDKTKEFLRNLAQNDSDQNVREVAAQAVALM